MRFGVLWVIIERMMYLFFFSVASAVAWWYQISVYWKTVLNLYCCPVHTEFSALSLNCRLHCFKRVQLRNEIRAGCKNLSFYNPCSACRKCKTTRRQGLRFLYSEWKSMTGGDMQKWHVTDFEGVYELSKRDTSVRYMLCLFLCCLFPPFCIPLAY